MCQSSKDWMCTEIFYQSSVLPVVFVRSFVFRGIKGGFSRNLTWQTSYGVPNKCKYSKQKSGVQNFYRKIEQKLVAMNYKIYPSLCSSLLVYFVFYSTQKNIITFQINQRWSRLTTVSRVTTLAPAPYHGTVNSGISCCETQKGTGLVIVRVFKKRLTSYLVHSHLSPYHKIRALSFPTIV